LPLRQSDKGTSGVARADCSFVMRPHAYRARGIVIGVGFAAAVLAFRIVTLASAGAVDAVRHWFLG